MEVLSKEKFVFMIIRDKAKKKALKEKSIKDVEAITSNRIESCLNKKRHAMRY